MRVMPDKIRVDKPARNNVSLCGIAAGRSKDCFDDRLELCRRQNHINNTTMSSHSCQLKAAVNGSVGVRQKSNLLEDL